MIVLPPWRAWALRGPLVPEWNPMTPGNCQLWWEGDTTAHPTAVVLNGGDVSQMTDLTGLGHHLPQAVEDSQGLWVPSGVGGVVRLDGADDFYASAAWGLAQPEHIFILVKWTFAGALYLVDGLGINDMGIYNNTVGRVDMYANVGSLIGPTYTDGTWCVIDAVFNGASSSCGINGAAPVTGTVGAANGNGITLGSVGTGIAAFCALADVGAFIVYSAPLSAPDRALEVAYLNDLATRLAL